MTDEGKAFRHILGHYPTGVCAVTAMSAQSEPVGMIVGSFTSASLDPMLIAFFPVRSSASWRQIASAGKFCVNVLSDRQRETCAALAASGGDKFKGIDYQMSELGAPILEGALAWIDCELDAVHEAGDHYVVLGKVRGLGLRDPGSPMIFYKGGFGRVSAI